MWLLSEVILHLVDHFVTFMLAVVESLVASSTVASSCWAIICMAWEIPDTNDSLSIPTFRQDGIY